MTIKILKKELIRRIEACEKLAFAAWKNNKNVPGINAKLVAYKNILRLLC